MFKILNLLIALNVLNMLGCRADKKFATQVDAKVTENVKETSPNAAAASAKTGGPVVGCDKSALGITQARLLSDGISTQLGTQTLRYELSVLNCSDGTVESLKDQPIFFDLDAILTKGFQPISYNVLDLSYAPLSHAPLEVVTGSDLFGKVGNYAHWTTQSFSYTGKLEKLILEIKLDNLQVQPVRSDDVKIDSFLRIGKAQPVTQALKILN